MARIGAPAGRDQERRTRPPAPALRRLVWLKWTLTRRGLARDRQRLIGAIVFLLFVTPVAASLGLLTYLLYRYLPPGAAVELLFSVLALLFAGWLIVPLFLYSLNESLDIRRLFLYPITPPRLMAGLLLTSLLDLPVLFVLAVFAAIAAAWTTSLGAALVVVPALLLLYGQMVAASQALLALFNNVLRSRRFRDISILVLAVFGSTFFLWQQLALHQLSASGVRARQLLALQVSPWLQWTPPGIAARAIQTAAAGDWPAALAWLGLAALALALLAAAWHRALALLMTSAETGSGARRPAGPPRAAWPALRLPVARPILALATKDLRYFWRDPQLKAIILNATLALAVLLVAPWAGLRRPPAAVPTGWLVLSLPLPVIFTTLGLAFNALGMERGGLRMLFLLPASPATLLLGKNLAVAVLAALETAVAGVALAAFSGGWSLLPVGLAATVAAVLVTLAVGNVVAVLLPGRMPEGLRATYSVDAGCARGLLQFGAFLAAWVLIAPVGAATALPVLIGHPTLYVVALPLALAYATALYSVTLRVIGPQLLARQPEIVALMTQD
jgi:ABC-2 type transport system permease protein